MAILIEEVTEKPGCTGGGCLVGVIAIAIIYFNRQAIVSAIISLLGGLMIIALWIIGIILVAILGYHLVKYLIKYLSNNNG